MNPDEVMAHTTFRQLAAAQKLWRDWPGAEGRTWADAIGEQDMEAICTVLAAKLGITVDEALDLEVTGDDDTPGGPMGNGTTGAPLVTLPGNGD